MRPLPEAQLLNLHVKNIDTDHGLQGDTVTSPTASMLEATKSCTLLDDVFAEDPTTISLEDSIARMTGKKAALFVTSGTMGNQLSMRTALGGPPHSVLADSRSHVIEWHVSTSQLCERKS